MEKLREQKKMQKHQWEMHKQQRKAVFSIDYWSRQSKMIYKVTPNHRHFSVKKCLQLSFSSYAVHASPSQFLEFLVFRFPLDLWELAAPSPFGWVFWDSTFSQNLAGPNLGNSEFGSAPFLGPISVFTLTQKFSNSASALKLGSSEFESLLPIFGTSGELKYFANSASTSKFGMSELESWFQGFWVFWGFLVPQKFGWFGASSTTSKEFEGLKALPKWLSRL